MSMAARRGRFSASVLSKALMKVTIARNAMSISIRLRITTSAAGQAKYAIRFHNTPLKTAFSQPLGEKMQGLSAK
jgi:hypothetical protein